LHPFPSKPHVVISYGWVKLHCVYICHSWLVACQRL
jgi:hypothetical protein